MKNATTKPKRTRNRLGSRELVRPLSIPAKNALKYVGTKWQKVPHQIRASHLAVLIRHGHIEHRWPFDLYTRMLTGSVPWLCEGEIRRRPNSGSQPRGQTTPDF